MSLTEDPETLTVEAQEPQVDSGVLEVLPYDLWRDELPLDSDLHLRQIILLIQSLQRLWHDRNDSCASAWGKLKPRWLRLQRFWHATRSNLAIGQKARKVYFGSSSCSVRAR